MNVPASTLPTSSGVLGRFRGDRRIRRRGVLLLALGALFIVSKAVGPSTGLRARYFANDSWSGEPALTRLDRNIDLTRKTMSARLNNADKYSVIWEGFLYVPTDTTVHLTLGSDDGSWLSIDDVPAIDNGGGHAWMEAEKDLSLSRGSHKVLIKYFDAGGEGSIAMGWSAPGAAKILSPGFPLYPEPAGAGVAALNAVAHYLPSLCLLAALVVAASLVFSWPDLGDACRLAAAAARLFLRECWRRLKSFALGRAKVVGVYLIALVATVVLVQKLLPVRGLTGRYFGNIGWTGEPVLTAVEPEIAFLKEQLAARLGPYEQLGVEWEGYLFAPKSTVYRLTLISDDGSWLYLDDNLVIDNGGVHPRREAEKQISLEQGNHKLRLKYFDDGGSGVIVFQAAKMGAGGLSGSALRFYPRPISRRLALLDAILPSVLFILKIALGAAAVLVLIALPKTAAPLTRKTLVLEGRVLGRLSSSALAGPAVRRYLLWIFAFAAVLFLFLRLAAPAHGLNARYYGNPDWTGAPVTARLDPVIRFEKLAMEIRAGNVDAFSAVWEGYLYTPKTSQYRFVVSSDDGAWVTIDDRLVVDNGGNHLYRESAEEISLARGLHKILIKYFDAGGAGGIDFRWSETKTSPRLMPRLYLYPRPISMAGAVLDVVIPHLEPWLKAILIVAGAFVLVLLVKAMAPKLGVTAVLAVCCFLVVAFVYEAEVFAKRSTSVAGCDSFAYLQGAELMARNGFLRTEDVDPLVPRIYQRYDPKPPPGAIIFLLSPHGYYVYDFDKGTVYNLFPPGTSFLLYPFVKLFGRGSIFFIMPALNVLFLVLLFALGAAAVDPVFGMVLGLFAVVNFNAFENSVWVMSDVPSTALLAASAFCLFRHGRRRRLGLLFAAGAFFGFAVVVRYSNLAGAVPLAALLWLNQLSPKRGKRFLADGLLFSAAAAMVGALPLAVYTARLFGTPFRLVYEPITQSRMSPANFSQGVSYYLGSLGRTFGVVGLGLMALGFVVSLAKPRRRGAALVCASAFLVFFLFFALHSIRQERYLLPAYPFLAVLAGFGLLALLGAARKSAVASALLIILCAAYPFLHSRGTYHPGNVEEEQIAVALKSKLEPGAVVFCELLPGPVRLYAGVPAYRFFWTDEGTFRRTLEILLEEKVPVYVFLDFGPANNRFQSWVERGVIPKECVQAVGRVYGIPLVRIVRPEP